MRKAGVRSCAQGRGHARPGSGLVFNLFLFHTDVATSIFTLEVVFLIARILLLQGDPHGQAVAY